MKTQKLSLLKSSVMIFITLLALGACSQKQADSSKTAEGSTNTETKISPPGTDIHTATFMGDIKSIKQHIAAGTNLNKKDDYGSTPLTIAATFGKTEAAIALIEGGADLNLKNNDGATPLHIASFFCRKEIVQALLAKGADKDIRNNFGSTPLESVSGSFKDVEAIYKQIEKQLGPLGLKLDLNFIEQTRPEIAEILK